MYNVSTYNQYMTKLKHMRANELITVITILCIFCVFSFPPFVQRQLTVHVDTQLIITEFE